MSDFIYFVKKLFNEYVERLSSDIKLRSIKQVSASLLADDDVPDTLLDWTSEFAGQWEDDRTADEVIEDIRGARTSNREIQQ